MSEAAESGAVRSKEKANLALVGSMPMTGGLVPRTFDEAINLAKILASSSIIPTALRGREADVLVIMLKGQELGLKPMHALSEIHVIEGRPSCSAALKRALCLVSPVCEYFQLIESTAEKCTYEAKRVGNDKPSRLTYTIQMAQVAGLAGKTNWKNHPGAMLRAASSRGLAEADFADVIQGLGSTDDEREIRGEVIELRRNQIPTDTTAPPPSSNDDASDPDIVDGDYERMERSAEDVPPSPVDNGPSLVEQLHIKIDEAASKEQLQALNKHIGAVTDRNDRQALKDHWEKRWATFTGKGSAK